MTNVQQRAAAKQFAADWEDRGDEKQETQMRAGCECTSHK